MSKHKYWINYALHINSDPPQRVFGTEGVMLDRPITEFEHLMQLQVQMARKQEHQRGIPPNCTKLEVLTFQKLEDAVIELAKGLR